MQVTPSNIIIFKCHFYSFAKIVGSQRKVILDCNTKPFDFVYIFLGNYTCKTVINNSQIHIRRQKLVTYGIPSIFLTKPMVK